jgi:hypothetical protein
MCQRYINQNGESESKSLVANEIKQIARNLLRIEKDRNDGMLGIGVQVRLICMDLQLLT